MKYYEIKQIARKLRQNMPDEEIFLWRVLRNRRFKGEKFIRQYPLIYEKKGKELFFFVADFYCAKQKLVIELDGKIHDYQEEHDKNRDEITKQMGLRVLRIKNEELNDMMKVYAKIESLFIYS